MAPPMKNVSASIDKLCGPIRQDHEQLSKFSVTELQSCIWLWRMLRAKAILVVGFLSENDNFAVVGVL